MIVTDERDRETRLSGLRQILIEKLVGSLTTLREVGGERCIPYMQLALALTTDLDQEELPKENYITNTIYYFKDDKCYPVLSGLIRRVNYISSKFHAEHI